jgi:hypothetical protein
MSESTQPQKEDLSQPSEEAPPIVLSDRRYKNLTQLNRDLEEAIRKDPY